MRNQIERRVMSQVKGHPFIVHLHYALQSPAALFFVMVRTTLRLLFVD
jgi:hypothetical protein